MLASRELPAYGKNKKKKRKCIHFSCNMHIKFNKFPAQTTASKWAVNGGGADKLPTVSFG